MPFPPVTRALALATMLALTLPACGGGGGSATPTPPFDNLPPPDDESSPDSTPPGGLYLGYYQEDAGNNPEDPTVGAFFLNLPSADVAYNGSMFFTYLGCQSSNVGTVTGVKAGGNLSGTWSGTVDGTAIAGPYSGTYSAATASYAGTYSNSGGKVHIDIPGCITYDVAALGTWEMFSVEQSVPADFSVSIAGNAANWTPVTGAAMTLTYVVDAAVADSASGNPVIWQTLNPGAGTTVNLAPAGMTSGKEYIVATVILNSDYERIAFGCKRFIAP